MSWTKKNRAYRLTIKSTKNRNELTHLTSINYYCRCSTYKRRHRSHSLDFKGNCCLSIPSFVSFIISIQLQLILNQQNYTSKQMARKKHQRQPAWPTTLQTQNQKNKLSEWIESFSRCKKNTILHRTEITKSNAMIFLGLHRYYFSVVK